MNDNISWGPLEQTDESQVDEVDHSPVAEAGDFETESALELVIATFQSEAAADAAFDEIKDAERHEVILVMDAAVVSRDAGNNLHVKDEQDWPGRVGALLGAGIGTILGTLGGPVGLVVGGAAGAMIGAAAAAGRDAGMSDERLKEFAAALQPGASMVIVVVAHLWSATATDLLTRAGGEVNTIKLTPELARQLHLSSKLGR